MDFLPVAPDRLYFDYAATTPLDAAVADAMHPFLQGLAYGNPSSVHALGRSARAAVEAARAQVASLIGATPNDIVFTASGTEADNLAVAGSMLADREKGRHGLVSAIEHHAVLGTAAFLRTLDYCLDEVPVDRGGTLTASAVESHLRSDTTLVSCMLVNNETGSIQPVSDIARLCRARGVRVHTDAVQAVGVLPVSAPDLGVDLLSLSAHKIHGPKGVGALYVRPGVDLAPLTWGGRQENGRRAGTENVAAIVGFGVAAELAQRHREARMRHLQALSDRLQAALPWAERQGERCVPGIHSYRFPGTDGEALLYRLDLEGIAASLGAACSSGALSPSHVLLAMGLSRPQAWSVLRFSMGAGTTEQDVDRLVEVLTRVVPLCERRRR